MDSRYQTVTLVLRDGRRGIFTGKVLLEKDEVDKAGVVDIMMSIPSDLPEGASWTDVGKKE